MGLRFDVNLANWISFVIDEKAEVPAFSSPHMPPEPWATREALTAFLYSLKRGLFSSPHGEASFANRVDLVLDRLTTGKPVGKSEFGVVREYFNPRDWTALLLPGGNADSAFDRWLCSADLLRTLVGAPWSRRGLLLQLEEPPQRALALTDVFPAFSAALEQRTEWPALLGWTRSGQAAVFPLSTKEPEALERLKWLVDHLGVEPVDQLLKEYRQKVLKGVVAPAPVTIIQISDVHLGSPEASIRLPRLETLLTDLVARHGQQSSEVIVLVTGDLMDTPNSANLDRVRGFVQFLRNLPSPAPVILIGNHDVRRDGFLDQQLRASLQLPLGGAPSGVFRFDDCGVCIVGVNSVIDGHLATGFVGERQMIDLANELDRLPNRSGYVVVAAIHHHPTPVEPPKWYARGWYERVLGSFFETTECLEDAASFLEFVRNQRFAVVLHGHKHIPRVSTIPGTVVPIVGCGSSVGKVPTVDGSPFLSLNIVTVDRSNRRIAARLLASRAAGGRLSVHAEHETVMVSDL